MGHPLALSWPRWHPGADLASKYTDFHCLFNDFEMAFVSFFNEILHVLVKEIDKEKENIP